MDISLLIWVVGGIVGFWSCFFLGSRTAYRPSMRWLRWTFVFAGFHFLFTALESPLESTAYAVITLLRWATGLIAIAFWHGWLIGVRGMTRVEGIVRKTHLGVAVDYALFCIAISLMPADATFVCPTVDPLVAPVLISVYLTGALSHIWLMTWRLHQRETIPVARAAFRALLIATTLVCVSIIAVTAAPLLSQALPAVTALIERAGYGLLCCGIALMGYGAMSYAERHTGRTSGRDYLVSGFASLGVVAAYESILIGFHAATQKVLMTDQALALGIMFIPVIIATHFGFDQLRDMLDWLRFGGSARRVRSTLRTIARQIGSEKPCDQVIHEVLHTLAHALRAERITLFWFERSEARLLAAYGHKPGAPVQADDLRAPWLQPVRGDASHAYLLPLYVGHKQRGALLISGSDCGHWILNERTQFEMIGSRLAAYVAHAESEPVTIPQHIHRLEEQARDVKALHDALDGVRSPSVFITTLGPFRVEVQGKPASYKDVRVGRHMLNGMFMYLVANMDEPVLRDTLIEIAHDHRRGRKPEDNLPDGAHYISGLRKILQRWGMADALEITDTTVTLKRHPSWATDTDQVSALTRRAEQAITNGQIAHAISSLKEALDLFKGDYLQEFNAVEYRIDDEVHKWEDERNKIEQRLLRFYLDTPDLTDADRQRMLHAADGLLTRSDGDPDVLDLIERAAQRCRDHRLLQRCRNLRSHLER